jgi:hypothetical protein
MLELETRRGRLALRATLAARYAFGQVTSLAYAQVAPALATMVIKSELQSRGYYYAQGVLTVAAVEAELGDARLTFASYGERFWSFDSGDPRQSEIQNNLPLRDTRLLLSVVASVQPLGGPVRLTLELDDVIRDSRLPGYKLRSDEQRTIGSIILVF